MENLLQIYGKRTPFFCRTQWAIPVQARQRYLACSDSQWWCRIWLILPPYRAINSPLTHSVRSNPLLSTVCLLHCPSPLTIKKCNNKWETVKCSLRFRQMCCSVTLHWHCQGVKNLAITCIYILTENFTQCLCAKSIVINVQIVSMQEN